MTSVPQNAATTGCNNLTGKSQARILGQYWEFAGAARLLESRACLHMYCDIPRQIHICLFLSLQMGLLTIVYAPWNPKGSQFRIVEQSGIIQLNTNMNNVNGHAHLRPHISVTQKCSQKNPAQAVLIVRVSAPITNSTWMSSSLEANSASLMIPSTLCFSSFVSESPAESLQLSYARKASN